MKIRLMMIIVRTQAQIPILFFAQWVAPKQVR